MESSPTSEEPHDERDGERGGEQDQRQRLAGERPVGRERAAGEPGLVREDGRHGQPSEPIMRASRAVSAIAKPATVATAAISAIVEGTAITRQIGTSATTIRAAKMARRGNSAAGWGSGIGAWWAAISRLLKVRFRLLG